jgi:hypothetical protein
MSKGRLLEALRMPRISGLFAAKSDAFLGSLRGARGAGLQLYGSETPVCGTGDRTFESRTGV